MIKFEIQRYLIDKQIIFIYKYLRFNSHVDLYRTFFHGIAGMTAAV